MHTLYFYSVCLIPSMPSAELEENLELESRFTLYLNLHPVFELSLIVRPPSLKRLKRGFFPSISHMGVRNFVFKNHLNQSAECPAALRRVREKLRPRFRENLRFYFLKVQVYVHIVSSFQKQEHGDITWYFSQSREQRDQLLCSRLLVLHLGRQEIVVLRPLAGPPEDQDQPSLLLLLLGELLLLLLLHQLLQLLQLAAESRLNVLLKKCLGG